MRPISELVSRDRSAWPEIQATAAGAPYPVELLPAENGETCLHGVQVTTGSWLGAVVYHTGGIVIDHGWLRVFGSGNADRLMADVLSVNEKADRGFLIAEDVLGGEFGWWPENAGEPPTVHYFAPESLGWQDLQIGYSGWLHAMLSGAASDFYDSLRWPGWADEVAACPLDHGIHTYPPLFTAEGKDLATVSRRPVPITELILFHQDMARQLDG
jgi:hypothetical protein